MIRQWRDRIIEHCVPGKEPWSQYADGKGIYVSKDGLKVKDLRTLPGAERRKRLSEIAQDVHRDKDMIFCGKAYADAGWTRVNHARP